jgi:Flp pilus assembly protein TadG
MSISGPSIPRWRPEQGQLLVLFSLMLVAILSMCGLVVDAGSAFAQRRSQQNAADLAALASANTYLIVGDSASAQATALSTTSRNGYTDGLDDTKIGYSLSTSVGASVTVTVDSTHRNNFLSILGMRTWPVSATATAVTGYPDTSYDAAPFIFSIRAFQSDGTPLPQYGAFSAPFDFGDSNGDVPTDSADIAWTNYGTGNVDSSQVIQIIQGTLVIEKTLQFGTYIGQQNNGNHTTLFDNVGTYLSGKNIAVPVVDDGGKFQGWASFHVVSATGHGQKHVTGYFLSDYVSATLSTTGCSAGSCPRYLGSYTLKLVN